ELKKAGKIRAYGVSNFDVHDMRAAAQLRGGDENTVNQVLYNLRRRGVEWDLRPWCREREIPLMAYSPLESDRKEQLALLADPALNAVADHRRATPAQIALAWLMRDPLVLPIPKASSDAHVKENAGAMAITLRQEDIAMLDKAFPPPRRATPLDVL